MLVPRRATTSRFLVLVVLPVVSCAPTEDAGPGPEGRGAEPWSTLESFRRAHAVVSRGLEALGGVDALGRAGGLALDGEGVVDLGTLLQGMRPFEGDPHPLRERLALLPASDRLVHELRAPINPDAASHRRVDHRAGGTYRIDLQTGRASWGRPGDRTRVERTVPHLLLAEILRDPAGLRHLGPVRAEDTGHAAESPAGAGSAGEGAGPGAEGGNGAEGRGAARGGADRVGVTWAPPGRGLVTLLFDRETGFLREVESLADLPVRGDSRIRWSFRDYRDVPGLGPYPGAYAIHVDDELLQEVTWTRRTAAPQGGLLADPEGIDLPEPTPFSGGGSGGGGGGDVDDHEDPFDIRELAPGVHLLVHLRTGFHMLFVELEDHVVAVDAPSGWWELQELPPRNWAGSTSPALGERYVQGIRSVTDKPVGYVVLTHHHGDHAGGVRAFVEAGATVLGTDVTRPVVERTLTGTLALAGRPGAPPPALEFESVDGERTLGDGDTEIRILDVGDNPHAEGMLAVWLPGPGILYVSDLFDPWGSGGAPSPQRLPVMRWFVEWLDDSGLEPDRIYAVHGSALVTEEHLAEIRRGMEAEG